MLGRFDLIRINDRLLGAAGILEPHDVRSLDAIHLASAARFDVSLHRLVTYDDHMASAAKNAGLTVVAPS